jgi:hypothetical protein
VIDSVTERIRSIERQIASIREMIDAHRMRQAQEAFKDLKIYLEAEYRRMSTSRGEAFLSPLERDFYQPFIQDAWTNSGISSKRWNSDPRSWKDALWSVSDYVIHWAGSVERASK